MRPDICGLVVPAALAGAGKRFRGSGRKRIVLGVSFFTGAPPLPWREKARCAEFVIFTGMRALSWREKSAEGMLVRRGGIGFWKAGEDALHRARPFCRRAAAAMAGESALRGVCPFHRHAHCHGGRKTTKGCLPDTEKREKAYCAGRVPFHRCARCHGGRKAPSGCLSSAWKPFRRSGRRRVAPGMSFFTGAPPLS